MNKTKLRNDIILIVVLLAIAGLVLLIVNSLKTPGAYVSVLSDGKVIASYPITRDMEKTVYTGENNADYNVLSISGGYACVTDANCRDRICAEHKPIKYDGETIICLPHKLVIRIDSALPDDIDVIS